MTKLSAWKKASAVLALGAAMAIASPAQVYQSVSLDGANGEFPQAGLIQAGDGNFYGTTYNGGANGASACRDGSGCGTVFRVTRAGRLTSLYSFCSQPNCADGLYPQASLIEGLNGNFYGTTLEGGAGACSLGCGTVFEITPTGKLTTLYDFCSQSGCRDGANLYAGLVLAANGSFYGTTQSGGTGSSHYCSECGTIFKMTPAGRLTTLYNFCSEPNCSDGRNPTSGLIQATDGNLYGSTPEGGTNGMGTLFKVSPTGKLTTLYSFCSKTNCSDGNGPAGVLFQATDGNFYGTTTGGGANQNGTLFEFASNGTITVLYSFCQQPSCADGSGPLAGAIQATDGNFYGTTVFGGIRPFPCPEAGCGTVFRITPAGQLTTLADFCSRLNCTDGRNPYSALTQGTDGNMYGAAGYGGTYDDGTLFSLSTGLAPFVAFVRNSGKVGQTGGILGQGFTGTSSVSINVIPANFTVVSDTFIRATVPPGATTGFVTVVTPSGTLTSNVPFRVIPWSVYRAALVRRYFRRKSGMPDAPRARTPSDAPRASLVATSSAFTALRGGKSVAVVPLAAVHDPAGIAVLGFVS